MTDELFRLPEWKHSRDGQVYVTNRGEIIGEVSYSVLRNGYYAEKRGRSLGRFFDETSAKKAVEGAS